MDAAFDAKEQVRQAIDIVDLVGSYVPLRRQGRNFVGICPWHDDSRPSLQVNPDRQSFKCWVCDVGGDIFSFVMRAENLEFREALEILAERAGVSLRARSPGRGPSQPENEKRTLLRVAAWAEEEFHRCLMASPDGEPGRVYLANRGITPEFVRQFHLGYAPDRWDWLLERAGRTEFKPEMLERVGLLRRREGGGGFYDWFRGRVIFSIRDARSRPIAFGGRVLPQLADEHAAKYINSPETPLFSKNRELYGLDAARDHFKSGGAIVMEGYTDCLMAHQHGVRNCVAVMGTALGDRHLQLLRRYTDSITLVLDGDEAGQRRTNAILDNLLALFEKNQVDLRILTLPEGVDPCDFIMQHGSDAFQQLLAQAADALEHKFKAVTQGLDTLTDTHRASQAAEQLLATLAQIRPAGSGVSSEALLREEQMLSRIARKFQLSDSALRSRLNVLRRDARARNAGQAKASAESGARRVVELAKWERELFELLLVDPTFVGRVADNFEIDSFGTEAGRQLFAVLCRLPEDEWREDFGRLMAEFDDPQIKNLLVELDESSATKAQADRERWFADLLATRGRQQTTANDRARLAAARGDDEFALAAIQQLQQERSAAARRQFEEKRK